MTDDKSWLKLEKEIFPAKAGSVFMEEPMIFQRKLDRAMEKLHEKSDESRARRKERGGEPVDGERPELEKGDLPAMIIAAFLTFIPAAILVLGGIVLLGYLFLNH